MTQPDNNPQDLKSRPIRRKQVYLGLTIAAILAGGVIIYKNSEEKPDDPIDSVFYQTTAQCEADIKKQQTEYATLQKDFQGDDPDEAPTPPLMKVEDCAAQMQAAQQEYEKTAPIYSTIADCYAEGVQCEATRPGEKTAGFRPIYGGTYIDPYSDNSSYIYYGGGSHRIYDNRPVYQSNMSGSVVTPYGQVIPQATPGRVTVPRHTSFAAPLRPTGTAAKGTIKGRGSQGFGSSFKGTGRGGK
jgi:uncharacterized protein YgiB involved in biofilm formation